MKKVMIKDCIKAVEMFNDGAVSTVKVCSVFIGYDECHNTEMKYEVESETITRLYLANKETGEEVRTVWHSIRVPTATDCINAAIAYNDGTISEEEMLHTLSTD